MTNQISNEIVPTIDYDKVNIQGKDGVLAFKSKLGARKFTVKVTLLAQSQSEIRTKCRQIAKWLYTPIEKPLIFSDEPNITYYAKVSGDINFDEAINLATLTITFVANDPYGYGKMSNLLVLANGDATVYNTGTVSSYPTIQFRSSTNMSGGITFTNDTTEKSMSLVGSFTSGVLYSVDMSKNTLRNADTGDLLMTQVAIDADFWSLKSGSNRIIYAPFTNKEVYMYYIPRFF